MTQQHLPPDGGSYTVVEDKKAPNGARLVEDASKRTREHPGKTQLAIEAAQRAEAASGESREPADIAGGRVDDIAASDARGPNPNRKR